MYVSVFAATSFDGSLQRVTRFLTQYITFVPRSLELIPFVQRISLDFIWMDQDNSLYKDSGVAAEVLQLVTVILAWLKVSSI